MFHASYVSAPMIYYCNSVAFTLAATTICWAADTTVNRCTVNGQIVFQQATCPGSAETVKQGLERRQHEAELAAERKRRDAEATRLQQERLDARPLSSLSTSERLEREQRENQKRLTDLQEKQNDGRSAAGFQVELEKYCNGNAFERLVIGMSEDQMLHCSVYRKPVDVNTTTSTSGISKQYVFQPYGKSGPTHYVYFRNGRLTSFQD